MKLHFRKIGNGKPVIILHGLLGSSDNWQTFGKQLAADGFEVYLVDLRNHGHSPHDPGFNHQLLAEDVVELCVGEKLQQVHVIGHSLGGKTAMTLANLRPELIRKLVIIDIAPREYPVHHRKILDALLGVDFSVTTTRKTVESQLAATIEDNSEVQFLLKNLFWKEKEKLGWRFNLEAIDAQIENVGSATYPAPGFSIPTLFINGERSDYISYDDEREIFDRYQKVDLKTAPGAGHWVHADNPGWLLEVVKTFFE